MRRLWRRFSGWPDAFSKCNREERFRRVEDDRGNHRDKGYEQRDGFGLREKLDGMLGRRMRRVMAVMSVVVRVVVVVEMGGSQLF